MTLGEKIKTARKNAGITQEQLAKKLSVSRQAITKWEADNGFPDIENLKNLAELLNVSIDYLLDRNAEIFTSSFRENISLDDPRYDRKYKGKRLGKAGKKDIIIREKFPDAEIRMLMGKQLSSKSERIIDNVLGFVFDAPFGIPDFINGVKNTDKEFYLINCPDCRYLAVITDEFAEIHRLEQSISSKRFKLGGFAFTDCGELK